MSVTFLSELVLHGHYGCLQRHHDDFIKYSGSWPSYNQNVVPDLSVIDSVSVVDLVGMCDPSIYLMFHVPTSKMKRTGIITNHESSIWNQEPR